MILSFLKWFLATIISWFTTPLFIIFLIHFLLLQAHLLVQNQKSTNPFFYWESGDVEYWVADFCYKLATVVLIIGIIIAGVQKKRLTVKQAFQVGIYGFSAVMDAWFFVRNGNHGTFRLDWAVVFCLLLYLEFLWNETIGLINYLANKLRR